MLVGLGTLGAIKVIGSAGALVASVVGLNSLPDTAFRRKLSRLYHTGDICVKKEIKKQGKATTRKIFPSTPLRSVQIFHDHIKATIILPNGMDPKTITDHTFLFKQVFGEFAHLEQKTEKVFQLSVYPSDMGKFAYDAKKVLKLVSKMHVPVYAGMSRTGHVVYDMIESPHLLIAGETNGGKSVALRQILTTWILHIKNLEMYCADLKLSEFHVFHKIPNVKVVYDEDKLWSILCKVEREARKRGQLLNDHGVAHVKDVPKEHAVTTIIVAIDEVAMLDSKKGKACMQKISKVIAIGRALGIYFVMSMQRPDREVLNGKIKNCLTVRMAFRHVDIVNSQISLGQGRTQAAEIKLSQRGRAALLLDGIEFIQAPLLDIPECRELLAPFKQTTSEPEPEDDDDDDDFPSLEEAVSTAEAKNNVVPMVRPVEEDEDEEEDDDL